MGKAASLANIGSIADSSLGFRNRIINGGMVIDQRNAGASVAAVNVSYQIDRWRTELQGGGAFTVQQSTTAPAGFTNSALITVTTADSSIAATDYYDYQQFIEGFNVADFGWGTANAQTVTLSFWVRSSVTGTFAGSLVNNAGNRSYVFTYTINSANTFEYKTVTIAGDTSGTWVTNNGRGIALSFDLGNGSTYQAAAGSWVGQYAVGTSSSVKLISTNGATFYITGVQLEKGSTATSFDYRPISTELQLAQRYYFKTSAGGSGSRLGVGHNFSTTASTVNVFFPVTMRISPTAIEQSGTAGDYDIQYLSTATTCSAVPVFNSASQYLGTATFTVASGLTAGQASAGRSSTTNSYLAWSAEL